MNNELDKLVWDFKEKTGMKADVEVVFGNVYLKPECQEFNAQHLEDITNYINTTFKNDDPKNFLHLRPVFQIVNGKYSQSLALVIPKGMVEMAYQEVG